MWFTHLMLIKLNTVEMSEAHMFLSVQLQPLALVCYHELYIIKCTIYTL